MNSLNKVLCIIPARSGSKTIKNKNILKLNNKELIYYSIKFAQKLRFLDKIIFSSDSSRYLKIAKEHGSKNLHKRSINLSQDNSLTYDLVKEIYEEELKNGNNFNLILILQPTSPFRDLKTFIKAYKILTKKKYDTVLSVREVKDHPERMKKFSKKNGKIDNYLDLSVESLKPRQKLNKLYIRSGSMYFFKSDNLKKYDSLVGKKVFGIKNENKYAINIDDHEDLILANFYAKSSK